MLIARFGDKSWLFLRDREVNGDLDASGARGFGLDGEDSREFFDGSAPAEGARIGGLIVGGFCVGSGWRFGLSVFVGFPLLASGGSSLRTGAAILLRWQLDGNHGILTRKKALFDLVPFCARNNHIAVCGRVVRD